MATVTGDSGADTVFPRVNSISGDLVFADGVFEFSEVGVTFAGDTVTDGTNGVNIFQGTQVAVVNDTPDFQVDVEGVDEGDFRAPSSGDNSQVAVLGTGPLTLDDYDVTNTAGFDANFTLRDLGLDASLDSNEITNGGSAVTGTVTGVQDGRNILVQAFNADDELANETTLNNAQITGGADFSLPNAAFDTGDFTVEVTDLASGITTDELSFSVGEAPEGSVSFAESTTEIPTGDVGEVTVNFGGDVTNTEVTIGGNREDFGLNFTLTDGDGDGSATFEVNSYGLNGSAPPAPVTAVGDDSVSSVNFESEAVERLGQIQLRLSAVTTGTDQDRAQLVLTDRSSESLTAHIAPGGTLDSFDALTSDVIQTFIDDVQTPSQTVAQGDDFVFLTQVNGISGYIDEAGDFGDEGVTFELSERDPGLGGATTLTPTDPGVDVVFDADNDRFIVTVDTTNTTVQDISAWDATFTIDGDVNPYVPAGETEELTSQVDIVPADMSFDVVTGDTYTVVGGEEASVFGSTNLAPGTDVTVNAAGDFFRSVDTTVGEEGSFEAVFDFSGVNTDQQFELSASDANDLASATVTAEFGDTPEDEQSTSVEELEQQVADLEQQLEDRNTTIDELNNEIDSLTEELNNTEDQLSTVEDERAELQNELANAEATIGDLESQVSDLESTNSDLESQVSDLESQVSELEGADEDLQTVLDELGVDSVDAAVDEIQTLSESGDSDDSGPGFGIAAALVALIAAALLAVRRRD